MTASRLLGRIRQLLVPAELRISEGYPDHERELLATAVEHFLRNWPPPPQPPPTHNDLERLPFLADVATGLWRMRRNMVPRGATRLIEARPIEEMRKPFRWLVSVWDTLSENGIEIQDHTGDRFDSGQVLKASAFEPTSGIAEETVIDTIKPSVYLNGQLIQMGDVVVGVPGFSRQSMGRTDSEE